MVRSRTPSGPCGCRWPSSREEVGASLRGLEGLTALMAGHVWRGVAGAVMHMYHTNLPSAGHDNAHDLEVASVQLT